MAIKNSRSKINIPWGTLFLAGLNIYVFFQEKKAMDWGMVNSLISDFSFDWTLFKQSPAAQWPNLISYTFLHGNEAHLISNLLFLIFFGPAVEAALGSVFYLIFYTVWGGMAALTQGLFDPFGGGLIGASGAISGVIGAFFVLFPLKYPPKIIGIWLGRLIGRIPAFFYIGFWFISQLQHGFISLIDPVLAPVVTMIAFWAHIGGFAVGSASVLPWVIRRKDP